MTEFDPTAVAEQIADQLGPEMRLVADPDPVLFGRALARVGAKALQDPLGLSRVLASAGTNSLRAQWATLARTLGIDTETPFEPEPRDRRWQDDAWTTNGFFFGLHQGYEVAVRLTEDLIELADVPEQTAQKARFAANLISSALAPTNFLPTNPAALKKAFDTGGQSVVKGMLNFVEDLAHNDGFPRQVDTSQHTVGENMAATPGKVVYRNGLMELIQYEAQTEEVHETPLLCSPPWINKYYIMDLAPGKSFIEWAVQHGHTVFSISYRNPDASMGGTSFEDYLLHGPHTALQVIEEITGERQVDMVGLCLGGALTSILVAWLAEVGEADRVNTVTLLNSLLDYSKPGILGTFTDEATIEKLERAMDQNGVLEAAKMRRTFDTLRPDDLIFQYVPSNWLMGEDPPAFDLLVWNSDSTNMPADMHSFYLRSCYVQNALAKGELELAGERLDLKNVGCDTFIVAAVNDHITPWKGSFESIHLLGGDVEFVLSSSGHIAGVVNPPSPKAKYWLNDEQVADPETWRARAVEHAESWWEHWARWMDDRSGEMVPARAIGSDAHPPMSDAPGVYVFT